MEEKCLYYFERISKYNLGFPVLIVKYLNSPFKDDDHIRIDLAIF